MKKTLLALATVVVASNAAHADFQSFMQQPEQPYIGLDYQYAEVDTDPSVQIGSVLVRAGTHLSPYLGVEAQYSYGVTDDEYVLTDATTGLSEKRTLKNRGSYGLYLKPKMAINTSMTAYDVTVYALIGANYADYESEGSSSRVNAYGTAFSAGVGVTAMTSQNVGFGAELMRYDSDIFAVNLGVRYQF